MRSAAVEPLTRAASACPAGLTPAIMPRAKNSARTTPPRRHPQLVVSLTVRPRAGARLSSPLADHPHLGLQRDAARLAHAHARQLNKRAHIRGARAAEID